MNGCGRIKAAISTSLGKSHFPHCCNSRDFLGLGISNAGAHKGGTGTSLSFLEHRDKDGRWIFDCNNPACGITGEQSEFWHQVVERARLQAGGRRLPQACADLLARVESGEIDVRIAEFEKALRLKLTDTGGPKEILLRAMATGKSLVI